MTDTTYKSIFQVVIDTGEIHAIAVQDIEIHNPFGIEFDPVDRRVYWSDLITKSINSARLDGTEAVQLLQLSSGMEWGWFLFGIGLLYIQTSPVYCIFSTNL